MTRMLLVLLALWCATPGAWAATVSAVPLTDAGVNLSSAQTGNGDSTNTMDRGFTLGGPGLLRITTTVGATPTVTVDIQGSMDATNFFNVQYSLTGTPDTWTIAAIVITTATTANYLLRSETPWRYLKLVYTSNTNVTLTVDAFPTGP